MKRFMMENWFLRSEFSPEGWAEYQNNILHTVRVWGQLSNPTMTKWFLGTHDFVTHDDDVDILAEFFPSPQPRGLEYVMTGSLVWDMSSIEVQTWAQPLGWPLSHWVKTASANSQGGFSRLSTPANPETPWPSPPSYSWPQPYPTWSTWYNLTNHAQPANLIQPATAHEPGLTPSSLPQLKYCIYLIACK